MDTYIYDSVADEVKSNKLKKALELINEVKALSAGKFWTECDSMAGELRKLRNKIPVDIRA